MKTKIYTTVVLAAAILSAATAQQNSKSTTIDSLLNFDKAYWYHYSAKLNLNNAEQAEFITAQQRAYIRDTYYPIPQQPAPASQVQAPCTNMDFENGTTNGWKLTTGFHPLFNSSGCCPTNGGAQVVVTGNGVDPCGGFPVVCPGGNFSLLLGDAQIGGKADRIEQTFMVTSANAFFTYKYAVVFQDPGHTTAQQPAFKIEMLDSNNVAVPCTYYNVSAGQGIQGFVNSNNCPGVQYKPWSSAVVDLTNYIGQNVTIRFSTYDCALGGHYGYAYLDGSCLSFPLTTSDTICVGATKTLCAPSGFATYTWSGGSANGLTSQCITVSNPGNYKVQTTLNTGCTGPTFNYPLFNHPKPVANFNTGNSTCNLTVTFNNNSSMSSGTLTTYNWNFGDGGTSTLKNPVHTYSIGGTYSVTLIVGSSKGCYDTTVNVVTINPPPVAAFSYPVICVGTSITFTNNSTIQQGNINQWNWNFGDGSPVSNLQNPVHTYTTAGSFAVTLTITSNMGCSATTTSVVVVNPKPNSGFNVLSNSCSKNINFTNTSSVSSGNITSYAWNFGDGGISTAASPTYSYLNTGSYTISLIVTSNNGCKDTAVGSVTIHPLPVISLSAPSACQNSQMPFTNNSSIPSGSLTSWSWNFGDANTSSVQTPTHTYTGFGNYVVTLTATSNFGCTASNTIMVTVNPLPQLSFTTPSVCEGLVNYFTNTSTIPSGSVTSWLWDFNGDGNTDGTAQNPGWTYPGAGNHTVILTAISSANCTNSVSGVVTVHPKPNVGLSATNGCVGTVTSFTNLTSTGNSEAATVYNWNFGNGSQSTAQNPQVTYLNPGTYTVTLSAVSSKNCSNTKSITVTVYPKPVANFSTTPTCLNQATQFNNLSTIQSGFITKNKWDFDNDGIYEDSTVSPSYIYSNFGTFNGKLVTISDKNCQAQKINGVIVHANPVANFGTKSTCLGDNTTYKNYSTSADGKITTYIWDFNGDNFMDNMFKEPTTTYTANGIYLTKLEVQTEYGCVNVMSKSVYVNARPIAKFSAPNPKGCNGICVKFDNQSSISNGTIVTNQWMFGDNTLPDYAKAPTHCYTNGSYNVTLTVVSDSGCLGSYVMPDYVTVYPSPKAGFAVTPDQIDEDQPVITVTNGSSDATSVKYFLNDGHYFSKENFQHVVNTAKLNQKLLIYQLVKNSYGCSDSTYKVLEIKPSYALYIPNTFTPNEDGLNDGFQAKGVGIETFKMQIFDRWGHLIFETDDINKPWNGTDKKGEKLIKEDTYVWKAQVTDVFHRNHDLVGHVLVLK